MTELVTTFVCWYVVPSIVILSPFSLQVTVVAGPPVEVQVRDMVVSLYTSAVTVGLPEFKNNGVDLLAVINLLMSHSSYTHAIITYRGKDIKWRSSRRDGL